MPVTVQQQWSIAADGGYLANSVLMDKIRMAAQPRCKFRQFTRVESDVTKNSGDTFYFNKIGNVSPQGRAIGENETVPVAKMPIRRGTFTVSTYGNSVPWTGQLEQLAQWSVEDIVQNGLTDDMVKVLDATCGAVFQGGAIIYTPTGTSGVPGGTFATGGVAGATATRPIQAWDIEEIEAYMKRYNMPKFDGENYMCVSSVYGIKGLRRDQEFKTDMRYANPQYCFSGEVGEYCGVRFVEENNVLSSSLTGGLAEMIFFGFDAVMEGIVLPEEFRYKIGTDYGRDKGLAWLFMGGWARPWANSTDGEDRMVRVYTL